MGIYIHDIFRKEYDEKITSVFTNDLIYYADLNAERLYRYGREALDKGDHETAQKCEVLNKIVNNCVISSSCYIGPRTKIAYGGIGVLIHPNSIIGADCMIGTNVTIGNAPVIGNNVYISTGARLIGTGIKIGSFSIIGANAVVTKDVDDFSIWGGVPAKKIGSITPNNIDKYLKDYLAAVGKHDAIYVEKCTFKVFTRMGR